jgi:hypothetical protein
MRWLGLFACCALLSAAVACGGGGGGDDVSAQETDAQVLDTAEVGFLEAEVEQEAAAEPAAETAETLPDPEEATQPDIIPEGWEGELEPEVVPDSVGETVPDAVEEEVQPLPDLTDEFVQELCADFCMVMLPCLPQATQESCVGDCHLALQQDPALAATYSCIKRVGCENKLTCPATFDLPPACVDMCAAAAACPNVGFAASDASNQTECLYDCAGTWFTSDQGPDNPMEPVLGCITDAYGECDLLGGLDCYGDTFCQMVCQSFSGCGAVGSGLAFESLESCLAACAPWEVGQVVAVIGCTSNFETCDNIGQCATPPAQPAPGAEDWCSAMIGLCGQDPGMWNFPPDVPFCTWLFTGMAQAHPEVDFAKGTQCLPSFESCPGEQAFGCLMATQGPQCEQLCELNSQCPAGGDPDCATKYCGFEDGQAWAVFMCLQMQQGCDTSAVCKLPPQEPYPDTAAFCTTLLATCGDQGAGNPALHDQDTCRWIVSGLEMAFPTIDLAQAGTCIENAPDCSDQTLGACVMGGGPPR